MLVEKQVGVRLRDIAACSTSQYRAADAARVAPDSVAVTLDDDALTFREIDERANRIANGLRGLWIGRGDRVLWWGETSLEAVPVFAALAQIRAVVGPPTARASPQEVTPVAADARPPLLLCGSPDRPP